MYLWDYMEEKALAGKNNLTQPFFAPPAGVDNSMAGLCGQAVTLYNCPSDGPGVDQDDPGTQRQRRRGNYVVNAGNSLYGQTPEPAGHAPFSWINGDRTKPRLTRIAMITDGTSHTLMMSEVLKPWVHTDKDWRGDIHNDDGEFRFNTLLTPNSSAPDIIRSGFFSDTGDPLMPAVAGDVTAQLSGARSRHKGGVNVAFCDGSVKFIADGISLNTFKALGSMDGGETIGDF